MALLLRCPSSGSNSSCSREDYKDQESSKYQDEAPFHNFVQSFCGLVCVPSELHEKALTHLRHEACEVKEGKGFRLGQVGW